MRRSPSLFAHRTTERSKASQKSLLQLSQSLRAILACAPIVAGLSAIAVPVTTAHAGPPGGPVIGPVTSYSYVALYVRSLYPNAPLTQVTVTVGGSSVPSSGAPNEFLLKMLPGASESVTVSNPGYTTQTFTVTSGVASSTTTDTVYLTAVPVYAGVSGTISDTVDAVSPATSTPVAGATVTLSVNNGTQLTTTTDASGNYTIPFNGGFTTGSTLTVKASAYGYRIVSQTVTVTTNSPSPLTNYAFGTTTLTPNNTAVFYNGSMGYIYGCNLPAWEYADFAPNYLAYWYPGCPTNYDFSNVETDTASSSYNQLISIEDEFAKMGALTPVNGATPMRTVRWFLFSQMAYTLLWTNQSGTPDTDYNAQIATTGANQNTINPATSTTDPLLNGITQSGLDYTTFTEIGLALQYAAQNNIHILFTFGTFYDMEGDSGNHRAIVSTSELDNSGNPLGSAIQDSYVNNALIPALKYITNWEKTNNKQVVFAYDTLNEPDQDTYGVVNGYTLTGTYINGDHGNDSNALLSIADVQAFVKRCATAIHTYGNGALATGDTSAPQVVSLLQNCGLDFYCAHYYGYWNDATNGDYPPDSWSLGSGLPAANTLLNGGPLDKPCVIEEMQTAEQTSDTDGHGTHLTANWILNRVQTQGYAGALGWGYTESYAGNNEYDSLGLSYDPLSHWSYFEPYFTAWPANNTYNPTTGTGVVIGPK